MLKVIYKNPSSSSKILTDKHGNQIRSDSDPNIAPEGSHIQIKEQLSAPFYYYSLKNEMPPFKIPGRAPKPKLVINLIVNEKSVLNMFINASKYETDGLANVLGKMLIEKEIIKNYSLSEKRFLISLLKETIDYAAQRDFSTHKLSVLLNVYLTVHKFFQWYYWTSPKAIWDYFTEIMIRHTIEDSPYGQEVFEAGECYDILTHFHTVYLSNLPLIHTIVFGSCRLKSTWPFNSIKKM